MNSLPPVEFSISEVDCVPEADNTPVGKSFAAHDVARDIKYLDNHALKVQLSVYYADLKIKAAEALQSAAAAKRKALDALGELYHTSGFGLPEREVLSSKLDHDMNTKLSVRTINAKSSGSHTSSVDDRESNEPGLFQMSKCDQLLERLCRRIEFPKCELPRFDGSPARYVMFFRQFDEQIERNISDDSQRLTYLYHYCSGKAKDAIEGCFLYPPNVGYQRARKILYELFGQRHYIVRALLDEVTLPGSVGSDAEGLSYYSN